MKYRWYDLPEKELLELLHTDKEKGLTKKEAALRLKTDGKNVVNPCSLLLSSVMMLEYMGWKEAAELIVNALEKAFSKGEATHDLARFMPNGHALGTNEFGQEIISLL